jgi:hypothetical protein
MQFTPAMQGLSCSPSLALVLRSNGVGGGGAVLNPAKTKRKIGSKKIC